jgi:hypothetical protein
MAQAQAARITCRVCDGWYDSEQDLREHMQAAHRRFTPEPSDPQYAGTQPQNVKPEPSTPNEEWTDEESNPVSIRPGRAGR